MNTFLVLLDVHKLTLIASRPFRYFRLLPDHNVRSSSDRQKKKKITQRKKPKEEPNEEEGPPFKRTRTDPVSYREESDDPDEDMQNVKMEATATVNSDKDCIDLCDDSSDEESTFEGREIKGGEPEAEHPKEQDVSASKIKELEQRIEQLKDESDSKIARLENELEQKEKVIAILKRRLGA